MIYSVMLSCVFEVEADSPGDALDEALQKASECADNVDTENVTIAYYD